MIINKESIFSSEFVNKGRQQEFDLLKATIIMTSMILVHTYMFCTNQFHNQFVYVTYDIIAGVFGAPLFIFCMGLTMSYTKRNGPWWMAKRGFNLLTVGFLLNITRIFIPVMFNLSVTGDKSVLDNLWLFFAIDIMQFAGCGFILMAILKKIGLGNISIFLVSLFISNVGMLLTGITTGYKCIDSLLGYLFWNSEICCFPLFQWFIFYAFGNMIGELYIHIKNKCKFYAIVAPIGITLLAAYIYITLFTDQTILVANRGNEIDYYRMGTLDALGVIIGVFPGMMSIFWLISRLIPQKVMAVLSYPSFHINRYFCISWTIICMIPFVFMLPQARKNIELLGYWLLVCTLTILVELFYSKYIETKVSSVINKHRYYWIGFIWISTALVWVWYFLLQP